MLSRFKWLSRIVSAAAGIVASMLPAEAASAAERARPNILLICVDDLKPAMGCYGDTTAHTPNIDRLAASGVRFELAMCNQAVCSPSRNALMTGLRPQTLGIYDLGTNSRLSRPDAVTLGQYFQQNGYKAESLGKIFHVGHGNQDDAASWSVPHWKPKTPGYVLPESMASPRTGRQGSRGHATESADVDDTAYADGMIADEAVRRLQKFCAQPEQPFLLAVGFLKPHLPFVAPTRYWNLFQESRFPLPELRKAPIGAPSFAPTSGGELRQYSDIPETGPYSDQQIRHLIHGYYAATSYVDAQIGKVLDGLHAAGLAENTIVILWGDHGWHLGDHGMWCKHTNYEQAARIPLIVSVPGIPAGTVSRSLVETVDIYPTLADLVGLPQPADLDGISFAPILRDTSAVIRDHAIHVYPRGNRLGRAVRTPRYRLVEWKEFGANSDDAEFELYDYQNDPAESANLAAQHPEVVSELKKILAGHPEALPPLRVASTASTGGKSGTGTAKNGKSGTDREALFARRDRNKDGQLTRDEFFSGQPDPDQAPARFIRFDANGDGMLSREEFVKSGKVQGKR